MQGRIAIVGGGIIGSATAYELSQRGESGIQVIDCDLEGGLSSSERNAGGMRQLWKHPINSELSRRTVELCQKYSVETGFQQKGYLWLFSSDRKANADSLYEHTQKTKLPYERWDVSKIKSHYPFIDKTEGIHCALFGFKDGIVNSNALKNFYRDEAKKKGVEFRDRVWVTKVTESTIEYFQIDGEPTAQLSSPGAFTASNKVSSFEKIILCVGAWSHSLAPLSSVQPVPEPIRRQISFFSAENFDMSPYGMVVDTSGVYFHPEGGKILAGYVIPEEKPGYYFHYDSDFFETHIWPALYERSSKFEKLREISGWGGLYSYTPDKTGIVGKVPGFHHVYEAHSFTGRGLMQSYGVAIAVSDLVQSGRFQTFDASALSRDRFTKSEHSLLESLHI